MYICTIYFSDVLWEKHFDPLFVMLRSMHLKDFQTAMDRYTDQYVNVLTPAAFEMDFSVSYWQYP